MNQVGNGANLSNQETRNSNIKASSNSLTKIGGRTKEASSVTTNEDQRKQILPVPTSQPSFSHNPSLPTAASNSEVLTRMGQGGPAAVAGRVMSPQVHKLSAPPLVQSSKETTTSSACKPNMPGAVEVESLNVSRDTTLSKESMSGFTRNELEVMSSDELICKFLRLQNDQSRLRTQLMLGSNDTPMVTVSDHDCVHQNTEPPSSGKNLHQMKPPVLNPKKASDFSPNTANGVSNGAHPTTSSQARTQEKRKRTQLEPTVFDVTRNRAVQRKWLARSASIMTKSVLEEQQQARKATMEKNHIDALSNMFRYYSSQKFQQYLRSLEFARNLADVCQRVQKLFTNEPRLLELPSPCYVLGDIHGNLEDLYFFSENVWPLGMPLAAGKFLFLGDYVDRGAHPLEVVAYLFSQKILHPDKLFLIRGNHETRTVNGWVEYYQGGSFLYQCQQRFGSAVGAEIWEIVNQAFDCMPLACVIDKNIFAVHGGIPVPHFDDNGQDVRLERLKAIPCPLPLYEDVEVDELTHLAQTLMWADPANAIQERSLDAGSGFGESARGAGSVVFGNKAIGDFLERYGYSFILRAHEATADGVSVSKGARVLTIFSTSKDHGKGGGAKCGCVLVDNNKIKAITRNSSYLRANRSPRRDRSPSQSRQSVPGKPHSVSQPPSETVAQTGASSAERAELPAVQESPANPGRPRSHSMTQLDMEQMKNDAKKARVEPSEPARKLELRRSESLECHEEVDEEESEEEELLATQPVTEEDD